MCGIAGYIGSLPKNETTVQQTLVLMKNRGPDAQQYSLFNVHNKYIYLLHSRLSIIDLNDRSNQPFSIGHYHVVFNGEIYNYIELRKKLQDKGIHFNTTSDTEVLLQYYIQYGEKCVEYFEGMWSFAIYDQTQQIIFLSRDRFGEKPLYYMCVSDGFYFGSEIKFIQSLANKKLKVNKKHLLRYLTNGYRSLYKQYETYFERVYEIPQASNLVVDTDLKIKEKKYWHPSFKVKQNMSLTDAIEGTKHYLFESMKIRLRSDVPLAFCLSGGVDSSSLTSVAAKVFNYKVNTFSIIDSDERYNEFDNIEATLRDIRSNHVYIHLEMRNNLRKLKELINYHDAPVATITYLIHSFLSDAIHKNGYKVAFSGTAADEFFTGYYDHFNLQFYDLRNTPEYAAKLCEWNEHIYKVIRNPYFKRSDLYFNNPDFRDHIYGEYDPFHSFFYTPCQEQFFEERYCDSLLRNRMLNELFHETTPVVLHEEDHNSMMYSIENRSPYLDVDLFNFAYSIPVKHLINKGYAKYILRESVNGILNDKVRLYRQKKGFNASIGSIVNFSDLNEVEYLLSDNPVFEILKHDKIRKLLVKPHFENNESKFIFNFINTRMFLELNE